MHEVGLVGPLGKRIDDIQNRGGDGWLAKSILGLLEELDCLNGGLRVEPSVRGQQGSQFVKRAKDARNTAGPRVELVADPVADRAESHRRGSHARL